MSRDGVRPAEPRDAEAIARIYNEGIEDRVATFETRLHTGDDFAGRIGGDAPPMVVADVDGDVAGWAAVIPYSDRDYYAGVGECMVYVARSARRTGIGRRLIEALAGEAQRVGYYKLTGKLFTGNGPSIDLLHACGFEDVGVHRNHGRLDGEWRHVLVMERLLGDAAEGDEAAGR